MKLKSRTISEKLVETTTSKKIVQFLNGVRNNGQLGYIFGETGRGKTFVCERWVSDNPGSIIFEVEPKTSPSKLIKQISFSCFGHDRADLKKIIAYFSESNNTVLVVDEATRLIDESKCRRSSESLDILRYIWDETSKETVFGLVPVFTSYTLGSLTAGKMGSFLEQFVGRMGNHLNIEPKISRNLEVKRALESYLPNPDDALIDAAFAIASGKGKMRTLYSYLILARKLKNTDGHNLTPELLFKLKDMFASGNYKDE